ncbi:putative Flp pilus-assembly TadE/G-like protein [Georgenia soli]|uniref:Putative Flp pilus-assembly TadE/G-like protein n=1 Tax=Georgenia soli TaxID=638953 RepID=A0A2A9EI94_9MICO|nr:pilus assembly protein TadG-related protein [Georgenia soli]PFG38241.1 putative Flp pilus-assembly TadE/G-like protein [Georgenia soli]
MQRLTRGEADERGAVAVSLALLMVALIGFAAISIDVAATYAERQQLQTGADAAALAIAQDCARDSCGDPGVTAQNLAVPNSNDGDPTATVVSFDPVAGEVTVNNEGTSEHWFAPVLGHDSTLVSAESTARWGYPSGGISVLPLALSYCEWWGQTGGGTPSGTTPRTIYLAGRGPTPGCPGPSGTVPGGAGWLATDGTCSATSVISQVLLSDPGVSVSNGCTVADLVALRNVTVLLPIFDNAVGTGSGATYRVYGYAAFKITGYNFAGSYKWNEPCTGDNRCIRGYFTQFVDLTDAFDYSPTAPKLGAAVVALTG